MYTRTCLCQYRSIRGLSQIWGCPKSIQAGRLNTGNNQHLCVPQFYFWYHDKSSDLGLHGFWSKTIFSEMETKLLKWLSPKCQPQLIAPTRHVDRADCHLACTWLPIVSKQLNRSLTVPSLASRQPGLSNPILVKYWSNAPILKKRTTQPYGFGGPEHGSIRNLDG